MTRGNFSPETIFPLAKKQSKSLQLYGSLHLGKPLAAKKGHFEITKLILGNVVEKNPPTHDGCTPLYVAASYGHLEIYR